jgi:hypothetical protein
VPASAERAPRAVPWFTASISRLARLLLGSRRSYAGVVAKIRLGRGVHVMPDVWRDAIVQELELAGDMVSFEVARRLRNDAGDRGRGAKLTSTSGEFKRAVLRALERVKVRFGEAPAEVLAFEEELRRDLGLPHLD